MHNLRFNFEASDVDELACVILETHYAILRTGRPALYRLALIRCGQSLDRLGVPPVHALIASAIYLQTCLLRILPEFEHS